ncbi:hypothetical protein Ade02nite_56400 [Paractinoplanes deccanensis]|uniref:DUF4232 domain-containing protein n=1 Tax=Paractinoplanes deccanensis TaxID=113561 RepID=A0ABQ3YAG5_9ACTN|nr:DUF4232 domain-containing protein [Actinoplanes deccanensis]GID76999.1 hypothetical protein Ade02nite_56400 [Actinoplanes deccanensis]
MITGVGELRRFLLLLVVPLLAACTEPWQATSGLAPTPAPSVAASPAGVRGSGEPTTPVAVEPVSACSLIGVQITADRGDAAMGYREMSLHLRNCGTEPYLVEGRPDIVVLDEDGRPLKISVQPSVHYTAAPGRLVLKPGTSARAVLSWRNTVTNISGGADTGASLAVAVSEGGMRQSVSLPAPLDLGNTGRLEASAWF